MANIYHDSSAITGALQEGAKVRYVRTLSRRNRTTLTSYMAIATIATIAFLGYFLSHIAQGRVRAATIAALSLVVILETIRLLQSLTLFIFAYMAKDPVPLKANRALRVAVLTTIVPSKEPFSLVAQTLQAMKRLELPAGAKVDVWLLDEGNDPAIRARCEAMGVRYFSRKGYEGWNTAAGQYKARTKHGNHNAWRRAYERNYDVVAQMDPDHVPNRDFLTRTLGYFNDPTIGFVVAPQVYGNIRESWIARGAAFQAYVFHGIIQRGGNGMQAPLLIGTNHLYRTEALRQINGYQDSIIEDHLTSMVVFGARNKNGQPWRGVYTPDIIAVGEGPVSFTDYFNQQKRWAYGIWDIVLNSSRSCVSKMNRRQAITFLMLQFFYPSVALSWLIGTMATLLLGLTEISSNGVGPVVAVLWLYSLASSLGLFFWLRRFNLVAHERQTYGVGGMLLLMMCIPVYVSATLQALLRRPLTYAVTAKGSLSSPDTIRTFTPHLAWLGVNVGILGLFYVAGHEVLGPNSLWVMVHIAVCLLPIGAWYGTLVRFKLQQAAERSKRLLRPVVSILPRRLVATNE